GNPELVNFLRYSKGSGGESQSQLYRALDRNYINNTEFDFAYNAVELINGKNQKLITYLQNSNFKGPGYKNRK
ncbi:MAG: four helix bundle protein, partial [Chitinophagales bacterium]